MKPTDKPVPEMVKKLAKDIGGVIEEVGGPLSDGSGFAVMSMPLPKDHWLTADPDKFEVPPMPFRMGTASAPIHNKTREMWAEALTKAGRYAVRAATRNGKVEDFDPDALVQNIVIGMLGYNTPEGLSSDEWANPKEEEDNDAG